MVNYILGSFPSILTSRWSPGSVKMAEANASQPVLQGQVASGPLLLAPVADSRSVDPTISLWVVTADRGLASPLPLKSWSVSDPLRCSSGSFLCWSLLPYSSWLQPCVAFGTFFARGGPVIPNSPVSPLPWLSFSSPIPPPSNQLLGGTLLHTEMLSCDLHKDHHYPPRLPPGSLLAPGHSPPS